MRVQHKTGLFQNMKHGLSRTKLGELLVIKGAIAPSDLQAALKIQKETRAPLGRVLVENSFISKFQLAEVLGRQILVRLAAAVLLTVISFASIHGKKAHADIQSVPASLSIRLASFNEAAASLPLMGSEERRSTDLKAFTKWSGVFERFTADMKTEKSMEFVQKWHDKFGGLEGLSMMEKIERVNKIVNAERYIIDQKNWGKSDYWATPAEFFERGGDCEDFAIAKYVALHSLGISEDRLRLAVVHDNEKNIPHAVLVVYTDTKPLILDNQIKEVMDGGNLERYRPIFSINRSAWWLHTAPQEQTILASR